MFSTTSAAKISNILVNFAYKLGMVITKGHKIYSIVTAKMSQEKYFRELLLNLSVFYIIFHSALEAGNTKRNFLHGGVGKNKG